MIRESLALVGYVSLIAALLFLPTGDVRSWRAWTLLSVLFAVRLAGVVALHRVQAGQPLADRVLLLLFMASFAGLFSFASFDAAHPSLGAPPANLAPLGLALFVAGWRLAAHALAVNPHAVLVVKHQPEREHAVTDTGAYRIVRRCMRRCWRAPSATCPAIARIGQGWRIG